MKNMTSSVGMMKFPNEWKNKNNIPNHQPVRHWAKRTPTHVPSKCTSLRKIMAIVNQAMVLSLLHIIHAYYISG